MGGRIQPRGSVLPPEETRDGVTIGAHENECEPRHEGHTTDVAEMNRIGVIDPEELDGCNLIHVARLGYLDEPRQESCQHDRSQTCEGDDDGNHFVPRSRTKLPSSRSGRPASTT